MPKNTLKVEHAPRHVIAGKLLTTLMNDQSKVAMLLTQHELDFLISVLDGDGGKEARDFADDMRVLSVQAFGKKKPS